MSEPASRPTAFPSLEQLRKQAKELLRDFKAGSDDAIRRVRAAGPRSSESLTLSDAQHVLARENGFDSWPKLVHHIETTRPEGLAKFERFAEAIARAYVAADVTAIREINWTHGTSYIWDRDPERMRRRLPTWFASETRSHELAVADAQLLVAKQSGFDSWPELVQQLAAASRGKNGERSPRKSPAYRVDEREQSITVNGPVSDRDWEAVVEVIRDLRLTRLNAGGQITDKALARLGKLDHITHLDLGGAKRLTYAGLKHLAGLRLVALDLGGWGTQLEDEGLQVLRDLPSLQRLSLMWAQRVSDAGIANAAGCIDLEFVNLMGTQTGDGALRALTGKPRLRFVDAGTGVTPSGLRLFNEFPVFKDLLPARTPTSETEPTVIGLNPAAFVRGGLDALAGLRGLASLRLFTIDQSIPPVERSALDVIADSSSLETLWCDPTNEAMQAIASMPRLRELVCAGSVTTDDGWRALNRSPTIERVAAGRAKLSGVGLRALTGMPALRSLAANLHDVDDASLATLASRTTLRELTPFGLGDDGFRYVGACIGLEVLYCMHTIDMGDAATQHIAGLQHLRKYYAGDTRITDRSLEVLAGLPSLEDVELWSCLAITNAGLAALARAPRLRSLAVGGSPLVTNDALKYFSPKVRVSISG